MSFSSGPQGGTSYSVPRYNRLVATTLFVPVAGANPLDDNAPHLFNRIAGLQYLTVRNEATDFEWKITLNGGSNNNSGGYLGPYDPSSVYYIASPPVPRKCTVTPLTASPTSNYLNRFQIDTSAPDSRQYILEYSPYNLVQPRITLVGPDIGNATVTMETEYFRYILA